MKNQKENYKIVGVGIVTAIVASLCCITPILAMFAGVSGVASIFSWIEPFRPFLIWITVLVLVFAWYQKLIPITIRSETKEKIKCDCGEDEKLSFWNGKLFLGILTIFVTIILVFPHYSSIFYQDKNSNIVKNNHANISEPIFKVKGLTCESCNQYVKYKDSLLSGYIDAKTDFKTGMVHVRYDTTKSTMDDTVAAIHKTGYKIVEEK